jgi:hypothetical protein
MATSDWDFTQCSRLKLERTKRRQQKTEQDKKLIHLHKELKRICEAKRHLGLVALDPPIQKGWKRYFVLRTDVGRSKDAVFFQELLNKVNATDYSDRKDFKVRKRKSGTKTYEIKPKRLSEFCNWQFQKLKLTEKEKLYFKEEWRLYHKRTGVYKVYVFTEPWRFVPVVKPNIITHAKTIDPLLEQAEDEIENHLERNHLRPRLFKLLDGKYGYRDRFRNKAKYDYISKENLIAKQRRFDTED